MLKVQLFVCAATKFDEVDLGVLQLQAKQVALFRTEAVLKLDRIELKGNGEPGIVY